MICPNCGREINDGSTFCPFCGAKMPEQPMYSASPVPPQPPMGQPAYYSGNMNTNVNKPDNTGLVAMVLGIVACTCSLVSLAFAWWLCILGLICGITGVVFGVKAGKQPNIPYAKPGKILSIVGLCVSGAVCIFIVLMTCWAMFVMGSFLSAFH